jgi:WD40 repeat protein
LIVADLFPGVEGRIYSLTASPTENRILVGFEDGVVSLFDLDTNTEIHRLSGHGDKVYDLDFSPDGRTAISGGGDHQVIYWDLETGTAIHRLDGHMGWVRAVEISPDGRSAVTGGFAGDSIVSNAEPGELMLWDLASGELILGFGEQTGGQPYGVVDAAFTPDGRSVLASYGIWTDVPVDFTQILWDTESGEPVYVSDGFDHDNYSVAITTGGGKSISGGSDNNVHIWDLRTGEKLKSLAGHGSLVSNVVISPDDRRVFTSDWNGGTILWDLVTGEILLNTSVHNVNVTWNTYDEPPVITAITPDGRRGISSAGDGSLVIWDLVNAGQIQRLDGHGSEVTAVAFTPDGKHVLTVAGRLTMVGDPGDDNTMKVWEVETGRLVRVFEGHTDTILVVAVSPDGNQALTGGGFDGIIKLWDLNTGELIRSLDAHPTGVFSLAFSPNGQQALSGPMGAGVVILWDLATGEIIHRLPETGSNSVQTVFVPGTNKAFIAYEWISELDIVTGDIYRDYKDEKLNYTTGFAIHPDWKSLFNVSGGGPITHWDLESDRLIREFGDHNGSRSRIEISPDGDLLFTSDSTGQLYLWDPTTGNEIRRFRTDTSIYLFDIDISPDGRTAITPAGSGSAILWDLTLPMELDAVLDWVSTHRYVRDLTCEERVRYSIEPICESNNP